jgi:hypothetical protein
MEQLPASTRASAELLPDHLPCGWDEDSPNQSSRLEPLNGRGNGIAGFPTGEPADWKVGVTEESFTEGVHGSRTAH